MICPQCGKELELPEHATGNMRTYGNPIFVVSKCCKTVIRCTPVFAFRAAATQLKEDDWGHLAGE